jgi:hypothetical protein
MNLHETSQGTWHQGKQEYLGRAVTHSRAATLRFSYILSFNARETLRSIATNREQRRSRRHGWQPTKHSSRSSEVFAPPPSHTPRDNISSVALPRSCGVGFKDVIGLGEGSTDSEARRRKKLELQVVVAKLGRGGQARRAVDGAPSQAATRMLAGHCRGPWIFGRRGSPSHQPPSRPAC